MAGENHSLTFTAFNLHVQRVDKSFDYFVIIRETVYSITVPETGLKGVGEKGAVVFSKAHPFNIKPLFFPNNCDGKHCRHISPPWSLCRL